MKLPPLSQPERYVGLFVYDFKTHVSVGYTAVEIRYLRESTEYRAGTAYEIYRVTDNGGLELRGAIDQRLTAKEAMCFLRHQAEAARTDYDSLLRGAAETPLPCSLEIVLAKVYSFDPPETSALIYPASVTHVVSGWLRTRQFYGGDRVVCGIDVHSQLIGSDALRIASFHPRTTIDYRDRTSEDVMQTVHLSVQR